MWMQLTAARFTLYLTVLLGLLLSGSSAAEDDDAGVEQHQQHWYDGLRIATQSSYFRQFDRGGIEQVDESGWVVEDLILIDVPVSDHDRLSLRLMGDVISSASMERKHNQSFQSLQSEASINVHGNGRLGWRHAADDWDLGVWGGASWDYLYAAGGFGPR